MARPASWASNFIALAACLCVHASVVLAEADVQSDEITLEWNQIFIHFTDGPAFSLMVEPDETGVDLRRDIYEQEGIPDIQLKPMVGDTLVDFTMRLSEANIRNHTIVTVGMSHPRENRSIEFNVRTLDGRDIPVATKLGDTVASLKDNITQWTGIPQMEQRLLCRGKELKDDRKLLHYHIENGTILYMGRRLEECRQVVTMLVETLSGAMVKVEVNLADTVNDLKEKIWEKAGVPAGVQRLSVNERMITGEDRLCDHGLEAGSTVYMYLYSAQITNLDQVARLQEPPVAHSVNPYKAPSFREVEDVGESVQGPGCRTASLYKDARNWVARGEHRPFFANDLFDRVAHLAPNPDSNGSIQYFQELYETRSRPDASERDRMAALLYREQIKLSFRIRPYREAANLTSVNYINLGPGITLGGRSTRVSPKGLVVPLIADINNWAPDGFTDLDVMRLFEVAERVREVLASDAQTGEGILTIAGQRQINYAILFTYLEALAGHPQSVLYQQPRDDEECGICRDDLPVEPATKLSCEHAFHADCLSSWAVRSIQMDRFPSCPSCRQKFTFPYADLGKVELEKPGLHDQANYDE